MNKITNEVITLTVTEGITENAKYGTVRCFFNTDFDYGYWVAQSEVETIIKEKLNINNNLKFKISKDEANYLIKIGQTPYKKTYF